MASITSKNTGSSVKHCRRFDMTGSSASADICSKSLISPECASQSLLTVHSLPSSSPIFRGCPSHWRLSPLAIILSFLGTCLTSMMLCVRIPSLQHVCAALSLLLMRTSFSAWQSVSTSTGNPHIISENLLRENFNAANSSRNGL